MLRAIDPDLRRTLEAAAAHDPRQAVVDTFQRLLLRQAFAPMCERSGLWGEHGGLFGELWLDAIVARMPSLDGSGSDPLDMVRDGWVKET